MTDPIAEVVEGGISGFIKSYEIYFIFAIMGVMFGCGIYAENIWHGYIADKQDRAEITIRDNIINKLQDEVKSQSDLGQDLARKNAALIDENLKLTAQVEATYEKTPAITTACIAPVRVSIINKQRAAADSGRAR